jgi:hypothetical protein
MNLTLCNKVDCWWVFLVTTLIAVFIKYTQCINKFIFGNLAWRFLLMTQISSAYHGRVLQVNIGHTDWFYNLYSHFQVRQSNLFQNKRISLELIFLQWLKLGNHTDISLYTSE